jgi:hypothetical protein|tara:strand:+ start:253 stop:630 length:378 start_codon:yes stop_codon:yes gene_type:complete
MSQQSRGASVAHSNAPDRRDNNGWIDQASDGSATLRLRLIPRAKCTQFGPVRDGRLVVRIARPPVAGKANRELVRFLAGAFGCSTRLVSVLQGENSRDKLVGIARLPAGLALASAEQIQQFLGLE